MFSLEAIANDILALINTLPQKVEESGIPDASTLPVSSSGTWKPFITVQFGDPRPRGGRSMIGARGHDYVMPFYVQVTAPTAAIARGVVSDVIDLTLGATFEWSGQIEKLVGGRIFPLKNSDGSTEAYIAPASFGIPIQFGTVA